MTFDGTGVLAVRIDRIEPVSAMGQGGKAHAAP